MFIGLFIKFDNIVTVDVTTRTSNGSRSTRTCMRYGNLFQTEVNLTLGVASMSCIIKLIIHAHNAVGRALNGGTNIQ